MDLSANFFHDVQDDETLTGKVTEKSSSYEMGTFYEDGEEAAKIWVKDTLHSALTWIVLVKTEPKTLVKYRHRNEI
jgi:hypothetical protein